MSRLLKALLASLLIVLLLAVAGCGDQTDTDQAATTEPTAPSQLVDQTDEWNRLLDQANAIAEENYALQERESKLEAKLDKVDITPESAADGLPVLAKMKATNEEMKRNSQSIAALWDEILGLDISDEHNTYADQQSEIWELWAQYYGVQIEGVTRAEVVYDPSQWLELGEAGFEELMQEATDLEAESKALDAQIAEKEEASSQYYDDNIGGE